MKTKSQKPSFNKLKKAVDSFRDYDYAFNLKVFAASLQHTMKAIKNGHEEDKSRNQKVVQMGRAIELLNNFVKDNFLQQAEAKLGKVKYKKIAWKEIQESDEPRLVDKRSKKEKAHHKKVVDLAKRMEASQWDELWAIIKGDAKIKGSDMRGWWD